MVLYIEQGKLRTRAFPAPLVLVHGIVCRLLQSMDVVGIDTNEGEGRSFLGRGVRYLAGD